MGTLRRADATGGGENVKASLVVDPGFRVADVDERVFGSFVEHMGRAVYGGIYEPDHPAAT
jgi:alpha-N-arabinofuranosidase